MVFRNLHACAWPLFCALLFTATSTSLLGGCTKKVDDKDNTINFSVKSNVKGLDPMRASDLYSSTVVAQMYEGLMTYHYLKRPMELQPLLADGMPTISPDGLTYTFKIKKDVRFHDNPAFPDGKGREVTAGDFIYSWKRLADPRNASEGFWVFDDKIKGLNEWAQAVKAEKANYDTAVEGLTAPDSHTLVIKLKQPYHQLSYVLAMSYTAVVPKEAVEKYGQEFLNQPVGTGPFILERWDRGSKVVMKRSPNWRGDVYPSEGEAGDKEKGLLGDAGKPIPFADRVVIHEIIEDAPRWQNYMKGNLDFVEIPNDNFDAAVKDGKLVGDLEKKGMKLDVTPNVDVIYSAFNMKDPVLGKNKLLRHAMTLASDSATFVKKFYNGRGIVAQGPIPPGVDGYEAEFKNPLQAFNVEKAKEMLAKAGFPEGKGLPEFVYESQADSKSRQHGEFFQQNMAAIGIKVRLGTNTWPQFLEKIKNQKAQIFGIAWGADYPDGQNFLQLFYGKNLSPGPNDTSFQNAEFDRLYEQALGLPPGPERTGLYKKMRDIVTEETPWAFIAHRVGYYPFHGWLNNYKRNDIANDTIKFLRVDAAKKATLKEKL